MPIFEIIFYSGFYPASWAKRIQTLSDSKILNSF